MIIINTRDQVLIVCKVTQCGCFLARMATKVVDHIVYICLCLYANSALMLLQA